MQTHNPAGERALLSGIWYNQTMDRKQKLLCVFGATLLAAADAAMAWQLYTVYFRGMRHVASGLLMAGAVCLPLLFGTFLLARSFDEQTLRRRVVRTVFAVLFGYYLAVLLGALIVSRIEFAHFVENAAYYREHFELMTNFHPLETVLLYLRALKYNYIGPEIPISNLIGNMLLFMPMAVFLPCLFRTMQKLWVFTLSMAVLLVAIEALQLLLSCGSCDIDDVLLNFAGTMIVYGVAKIPAVKHLLGRLYLLPEPKAKQEAPE